MLGVHNTAYHVKIQCVDRQRKHLICFLTSVCLVSVHDCAKGAVLCIVSEPILC